MGNFTHHFIPWWFCATWHLHLWKLCHLLSIPWWFCRILHYIYDEFNTLLHIYIPEEFTTLFPIYPSGFVSLGIYIYITYSEKKINAFGEHLILHQLPSLKIGGILCILLKSGRVITFKSRHNIPLTPMPHDLYRFGSW